MSAFGQKVILRGDQSGYDYISRHVPTPFYMSVSIPTNFSYTIGRPLNALPGIPLFGWSVPAWKALDDGWFEETNCEYALKGSVYPLFGSR